MPWPTRRGRARERAVRRDPPGQRLVAKNWPAEQYAEVVDRLQREHGLASVILGGPADALTPWSLSTIEPASRRRPSSSARCWWSPPCSGGPPPSSATTGLAHLAGLLGVPTLALFGPSDPTLWAPLGPRVRVLRSASLAALLTDAVLSDLTSLLGA